MNAFCRHRIFFGGLVAGLGTVHVLAQAPAPSAPTPTTPPSPPRVIAPGQPPAAPAAALANPRSLPQAIMVVTGAPPRPQPFVVRPAAPPPATGPQLPPPVLGPVLGPPPARVAPRLMSDPVPTTPSQALVFDAELKEVVAEPGQLSAHFTFYLTNTAPVAVSVYNVHTSCGCTVARLPAQPWNLAPGASGPIAVSLDLRGKRGVLTKSVTIQSTSGVKNLTIKASIPDASGFVQNPTDGILDPDRVKNIQKSLVDRQIVFKDKSCAECHADKAVGTTGKKLYDVACGICHDAPHRATMVTDFKQRNPGIAEGWRQWILYGKTNTLMPAFAKSAGGILSDEQVNSLAAYVAAVIPPALQFSGPATVPPGVTAAVFPSVPTLPRIAPPVATVVPTPLARRAVANPPAEAPSPPPIPDPAATLIDSVPFPKDN